MIAMGCANDEEELTLDLFDHQKLAYMTFSFRSFPPFPSIARAPKL